MATRYPNFLRRRYRTILSYTGVVSLFSGLLILSPVALLPFYPNELYLTGGFLGPGLGLAGVGFGLWFFLKSQDGVSLTLQEGTIIVVLAWLLAIVFGALPFMLISGLNFTQAIFEATSAWTTTGLSVVDVTQAPRLVLFYRSVLQLAGGAGLAIIALSALTGPLGPGLSSAEGRSEQLLPHVQRSVKLVLMIYAGYVVVGTPALYLAGMDWFDAINHAFAALSTGGFSTRVESIGYWDSPLLEAVTIVLMLAGTINFLTAYILLQGKFKAFAANGEIRLMALFIPVAAFILFLGVTAGLYPTLTKAVRVALFEVVTALSTTGFSTVGYGNWGDLGWLVLLILMLIGGGAGSTAGGIKQFRVYALYRSLIWELQRRLAPPRAIVKLEIQQGETRQFLEDDQLRQIGLFVFVYAIFYLLGSGILTAYGYPLRESLFEFASALGTVGLSIGLTSATAPPGVLWTEIVGMFLGRLEFFTIILGLMRLFGDLPALLFPQRV